jgi:hypothetical protein
MAELYVMPLSGSLAPAGAARRLTSDIASNPAWTRDNQIIFSSALGGAQFRLWRIGISTGAQPRPVEPVGEDVRNPAISLKSDRLVYTVGSLRANVWRIELPARRATDRGW